MMDDLINGEYLRLTTRDGKTIDFETIKINNEIIWEKPLRIICNTQERMYYKSGVKWDCVLVKDGDGISGKTITISINGHNYSRTTNDEGIFQTPVLTNMIPGTYEVLFTFSDEEVGEASKKHIFEILHVYSLLSCSVSGQTVTIGLWNNQTDSSAEGTVILNIEGTIKTVTLVDGYATVTFDEITPFEPTDERTIVIICPNNENLTYTISAEDITS